ncbi:MAG TPA: proline--tRNA ligase [Gammaproteobacteria bacterium]|nr:proline--tRNA ligase [Gammaproteobacteria bacterium]
MRTSQLLLPTLKETPADAEITSHQLMLRAGMIRKVAAGLYNWLPLGLRVVQKVAAIVREEMNRAGAQEILMPAVQPAELWQASGRWQEYGPELLRLKDRHQREFCFGPTHEEVVTTLIANQLRSYRELPLNVYQIQTKFRDEIRPRFGVMRSREFIMKDAYSFDIDTAGLSRSYQIMKDAYFRIFDRLGLDVRAVSADSGAIGGSTSDEFHVLADSGEDSIAICDHCGTASNVELTTALPPLGKRRPATKEITEISTPGIDTISELCAALTIPASRTIKTLLVNGSGGIVALVLRGDHELNLTKAEKYPLVAKPLCFASADDVRLSANCSPGSIGPVNLAIPVIVDESAARLHDFICGANRDGFHLDGVNWGRDLPEPEIADLRKVVAGDPCPVCEEHEEILLKIRKGVEVGHIFQLGSKYSEQLDATVLDEQGISRTLQMGCYGIGITRVVAAAIEQHHDNRGVLWPASIAPFEVAIVPIGLQRSTAVAKAADALYLELSEAGFEVLLDDRQERPGAMFADMDLIGIPHRLVISDRGLKAGSIEYKARTSAESQDITLQDVLTTLQTMHKL